MRPFRTFRRFNELASAQQFASFLRENGIPAEVENIPPLLDAVIIGQQLTASISVKVPDNYFLQVGTLLKENIAIDIDAVEPEYYLLSFTDSELLDIIRHPDEWGDYDNALAIALLRKRGIPITGTFIESAQEKRIAQLGAPVSVKIDALIGAYLLAFLCGIGWVLHYVFGMVVMAFAIGTGAAFLWARKTLPDGNSVPVFDEQTRRHGKRILLVALVMVPVWFILLNYFLSKR
ncbi:hypothetical protein GA0116948_106100 [Chitinophaga costaii]|uniref:Uncharacterized protein n=1 Tax=Chitinophaga costaii TaxID=1335309 RepID=A0A1C4DTH7_9BACT|nr:hypothetical protein [Chitinophaga costaii]PUZ27783.1 hypothetical protein DCM91_06135 [Chitinophaga costaii]SCC34653.1 hypothetical protein GA0116948_106100 [Chitinophaga costaii]